MSAGPLMTGNILGSTFVLLHPLEMAYDIKFSEPVLTAASRLTLKDLLDSPSFQCFLVSAVGNGLQSFSKYSDVTDERDEFLMFRLDQIFRNIPWEDRKLCFDEVARIYRERREERQQSR